ncbi:MAG: hypothetical protein A3F70_17360 [Acidobacteria bacterium RIFCSPLOWO2_12_FULL_67_14]|nr:MAG: hypothetical protein A3H29_07935 [Acidobacteria bacterium RIFCSPLOWO2_02_FULL_67_21]OFW35954.1 MAG: hypothetical protein A3F70_17360 [Acidobacteria bacterium RIFCSPLOWO2_12_FULL_67_14]
MTSEREGLIESRQRLAAAAGAALLVAGLVLVMFVLPAEFGVDPLGTGARAGLLELGATGQQVAALEQAAAGAGGQAAIVAPQDRAFNTETVEFTVGPRQSLEYKYRLDKGEALLYSWKASGPVNVEFHAEPDGAPRGYAQTYEKSQGSQAAGTLTAPFSGIHGWYWENIGSEEITVTLTSSGFYTLAHEFRPDAPVRNKTFQ